MMSISTRAKYIIDVDSESRFLMIISKLDNLDGYIPISSFMDTNLIINKHNIN